MTTFNNPFEEISDRLQRIEKCLIAIQGNPRDSEDNQEDCPITIKEASSLIKLAVPTIYGLVHKRKIPSYRRGKILYFLRPELLDWIKSGRQSTIQEIQEDAANSLSGEGVKS